MKKNINAALNEQIHAELNASYLYLSMTAFCESRDLPGFSHWMRRQNQEEHSHAMRLFDHVHARGGAVKLQAIHQPEHDFKSPAGLVRSALDHEKAMTKSIHKLYELASKESDYATEIELQWFITEQVEEEKSAQEILTRLEMIGDAPVALLLMDRQLAQRE